jgi:hypothetical protein
MPHPFYIGEARGNFTATPCGENPDCLSMERKFNLGTAGTSRPPPHLRFSGPVSRPPETVKAVLQWVCLASFGAGRLGFQRGLCERIFIRGEKVRAILHSFHDSTGIGKNALNPRLPPQFLVNSSVPKL